MKMKTKSSPKRILSMLTVLIMALTLLPTVALAADDVAINATDFPDPIFRAYVSDNFDKDKNGVLSAAEIEAVTEIEVFSKGIKSLKGVEYFTKLTHLDCSNNYLTSLDVSNNTELTSLNCYNSSRFITLSAENTFDLNTLPGFDVSKASDFDGGDVTGNILTATHDEITYDYKCGNSDNYKETFKLTTSPTVVSEISATITEPVAGATPATITVTPGDRNAYKSTLSWFKLEGMVETPVVTFEVGKTYEAIIGFTPREGYTFNDSTTATINGQPVTLYDDGYMGGKTCVVSYTLVELSYNANGGQNGPAASSGVSGASVDISPVIPDKTDAGDTLIFVGWSETQLTQPVTPNNYGDGNHAPVLADLYISKGRLDFDGKTVSGKSGYEMGNTPVILYAVWAPDSNKNDIPDFLEDKYSLTYHDTASIGALSTSLPENINKYVTGNVADLHTSYSATGTHDSDDVMFLYWTDDATKAATVYTFGGRAEGNMPDEITSVTFTDKNESVYAVWSTDINNNGTPDTYEGNVHLFYDANGGTNPPNDKYVYLAGSVTPVNFVLAGAGRMTYDGYAFIGWSATKIAPPLTKDAGEPVTITSVEIDADMTVYAVWGVDDNNNRVWDKNDEYSIHFDVNGGNGTVADRTTVGKKLTSLPTATKSGSYSLKGWYTAASGGTQITTDTVFASATTVYAQWTDTDIYIFTYCTLTFNTNGGITLSPVIRAQHTNVDLAEYQPTKTGYDFEGWYTDSDLTAKVTSVKLTNSTAVHAKWTSKTVMPFEDVTEDAYYRDAVIWAFGEGITKGTSATMFSPDAFCTRAQAVTFLWRAAGSPAPKTAAMPFNDVPVGSYYCNAVLWAVEQGIINGTSKAAFSPDMNCSRAHIVTMLWRLEGSKTATVANPFTDVSGDAYYADAVLWAVDEEITEGSSATTFSPYDFCTRAQIVTFFYRNMK